MPCPVNVNRRAPHSDGISDERRGPYLLGSDREKPTYRLVHIGADIEREEGPAVYAESNGLRRIYRTTTELVPRSILPSPTHVAETC